MVQFNHTPPKTAFGDIVRIAQPFSDSGIKMSTASLPVYQGENSDANFTLEFPNALSDGQEFILPVRMVRVVVANNTPEILHLNDQGMSVYDDTWGGTHGVTYGGDSVVSPNSTGVIDYTVDGELYRNITIAGHFESPPQEGDVHALLMAYPLSAINTTFNIANPQNNLEGSIIDPGTYTAEQIVNPPGNTYWRSLRLYVRVTAFTSGGLTVKIQGRDEISDSYYDILVGTKITATGFRVYRVSESLPPVAGATAQDQLPYRWRIVATPDNGTPIDYSVAFVLLK
jgi:hypothetical protein